MQEFSSISVSSFEADSLTSQLTEQSANGWNLVSIVPTGTTITAYLSRAAGSTSTPITKVVEPVVVEPVVVEPVVVEPAFVESAFVESAVDAAPEPDLAPTIPTVSVSSPVDEPAGWAIEPEAVSDTVSTGVAEVSADAGQPAAAAGAAPAGWYSDPSSRFELRYWDGNQWTEHVSRAGQQYTDPPVA